MAVFYGGQYKSVADIQGPSGFYNILLDGVNVPVYVDQGYSGGGWVMVLANRINTGGMNNLTYENAVQNCNYRTGGSGANTANTVVNPTSKLSGLANYNAWIGLRHWRRLAGRATANKITVVQFVSATAGTTLTNTAAHTKRYRWQFDNFTSLFAFSGVAAVSDETGTGAPGFYGAHAAAGSTLTTFDRDQDSNGGNCATYYNNNPFWYNSCWSGNWFAGGSGYADAPFWDSSGSDFHNYGAVYIK
jgi:hypothetical protein